MFNAARALFHAVHAIFPPPDITGHKNCKDSFSVKKLEQGNVRLFFDGLHHKVRLTDNKAAKYLIAM
jgi:hypothetical protein